MNETLSRPAMKQKLRMGMVVGGNDAVICDKSITFSLEEAKELVRIFCE
ncbi:MAG: hypothetical protein GY786_20825 [Proteobacteria bacterium]|nr:hypothetical protein [Pseudomonadota bacterium]